MPDGRIPYVPSSRSRKATASSFVRRHGTTAEGVRGAPRAAGLINLERNAGASGQGVTKALAEAKGQMEMVFISFWHGPAPGRVTQTSLEGCVASAAPLRVPAAFRSTRPGFIAGLGLLAVGLGTMGTATSTWAQTNENLKIKVQPSVVKRMSDQDLII